MPDAENIYRQDPPIFLRFNFVDKFKVHSNIEGKYKDFPYTYYPYICISVLIINRTRVVHLL